MTSTIDRGMTRDAPNDSQMGSAPCPKCRLCGNPGDFIHQDEPDRLFTAPGKWSLRRCANPGCRLVWLDPMPLSEELWKAYRQYYTHAAAQNRNANATLRQLYRRMKSGYLAVKFGYAVPPQSWLDRWLGRMLYLFPLRREDLEAEVRFLRAKPQGRLLDVGCGSGDWLLWIRQLGWEAEGLGFDEAAVRVATERGLTVRQGVLEGQGYAAGSFDAVTLNHVIEHVPDPLATVRECARILKPDGQLIMFTPNTASLGHRLFQRHWRGLEPPRHLHIFCPQAMEAMLRSAGFNRVLVRTLNSDYVWRQSLALWRGQNPIGARPGRGAKAAALLLTLGEQACLLLKPGMGEFLGVQASKS
jgi:2-polyprenyl-3-methyl-5-hydroxy-6-metoxy-1,4-benzoquinol methylase